VVSPLARVRWVRGRLEISAAGSDVTLSTAADETLGVLHAFRQPRTVRDVQLELPLIDLPPVVAELRAATVLVPPAVVAGIEATRWDMDSLAFHRRSRSAAVGGGHPPVAPPVAPARSGAVRPLRRPAESVPQHLWSVLDARRSRRSWSPGPIRTLDSLLWLSARDRFSGTGVVSRPYPSGGAAYSLELYLVIGPDAVTGIPAGVYRYRPATHALELVSSDGHEPVLTAAATAAGADRAPVVVVVTSRFERVSSTYHERAYSLVLKEVGALFQTLYLVAPDLGLGVCALGGGCPDRRFAELIGVDDLVEPVVGELIVGPV
jgi:SagB-type dehydrogenase family enzyme